jgi:hypothetical protein
MVPPRFSRLKTTRLYTQAASRLSPSNNIERIYARGRLQINEWQTEVLDGRAMEGRASMEPRRANTMDGGKRARPLWRKIAQIKVCSRANPESLSSGVGGGDFGWSAG